MKIFEVVELSESQELVDELIRLILKLHTKFTDPSSGAQTDIGIGKLQTPKVDDSVPKSVANFSGVERPEDVSKITADAIGTARENNDTVQIAQIAAAGLAQLPKVGTPQEKAQAAQTIVSTLSTSEKNDPVIKAAIAPAMLQIKMANTDSADGEAGAEEALRQFVKDTYPEAIPSALRSRVPAEKVPQMSAETIIKKAQELGMMSAFADPAMAVKLINQEVAKISKVENPSAPEKITAPELPTTEPELPTTTSELPKPKPDLDTSKTSQPNAAPTFTTKVVSGSSKSKRVQIIDANGKVVATVKGTRNNIKRLVRDKLKALGAEV